MPDLPCYNWRDDHLILSVRVQPRSSRDEVVGIKGGYLKIKITSPPVDGKANTRLIRMLADEFGVPPSRITLLAGETGREKRLSIHRPSRLPPYILAADVT